MPSALARELRENVGYLHDGGWHGTAALLEKSADELDRLDGRVSKLERRASREPTAWRDAVSVALFRLFGRASKA